MTILDMEWWAYMFIVLGFFGACMVFNYIVKKVNEAKLEERFLRMLQKASTTQSTQVHGPLIEMETNKGLLENPQTTPGGISLVFNQEENKRCQDLEETFNIIKNTLGNRKNETMSLSLKTEISQEAVMAPNTNLEDIPNASKPCDCESNNSITKKESVRIVAKKSYLEIPLKDSKLSCPVEKIKEDPGTNSFIMKTVDSLVSKVAGTTSKTINNEELQSENTLTDWIKDLLVPPVLDEDGIILKPNHASKKK